MTGATRPARSRGHLLVDGPHLAAAAGRRDEVASSRQRHAGEVHVLARPAGDAASVRVTLRIASGGIGGKHGSDLARFWRVEHEADAAVRVAFGDDVPGHGETVAPGGPEIALDIQVAFNVHGIRIVLAWPDGDGEKVAVTAVAAPEMLGEPHAGSPPAAYRSRRPSHSARVRSICLPSRSSDTTVQSPNRHRSRM